MSLTFERTTVEGFQHAMRAMRNPLDSWDKSDSIGCLIGEADKALATKLIGAGVEQSTFLRMIVCWVDITGPRLWWTEMDRYRIGKEQISCSTMHTIMNRPLMEDDFGLRVPGETVAALNRYREAYLSAKDENVRKMYWRYLIDNLPQSYRQKRTLMLSYQTIRKICKERKGHKLVEWAEFIEWAQELPESWMLF